MRSLSAITVSVLVQALAASALPGQWNNHGGHGGHGSGYNNYHNNLDISTSSGNVHGIIDSANPHVRQFLGIPYATPPLGSLRFMPPEPLPASAAKQEIKATALPPSCPQFLGTAASLYTRSVLQFNLEGLNETGAISEDCLTLSVWTPTVNASGNTWSSEQDSQLLPVLIFIYGGGFSTGGEDVPYQIPTQWVERTQDHIVVSFNYRINIFGFPNAEALETQNVGLLDQRLAIEWVEANIANFGGDPSRIALWGQSAGAGSVDYYNYAYPTNPIVSALIMDSGTAFLPGLLTTSAYSNFSFVASQLGCSNLSPSEQVTCMQTIPFTTIESFLANYSDAGTTPALKFSTFIDDVLIFSNYTARALAGNFTTLPAIIGTNANDGIAFAPYVPTGPSLSAALTQLLTNFFCPATYTIRLRQLAGRQTFRYLYAGNFSDISPLSWEGAYHSSELPLLMGTYGNYRSAATSLEVATSEAMQDAWVAFVSGGVAALEATGWGLYATLGADEVWEFGDGVAVMETSLSALEGLCDGPMPAS